MDNRLSTKLEDWSTNAILQVLPPDEAFLCHRLTLVVADGLAQLTSNEYLVLAGTLHGIHAITSRLSPMGPSSGAQVIEGDTFKMTILLTATGLSLSKFPRHTPLQDSTRHEICALNVVG